MKPLGTALIVDDSKLVTEVMKATLRPHCGRVTVANSLAEARGLLAGLGAEDLLLSDIHLGDGSGFELCEVARNLARPPAIIICSSKATGENRRRALELGALAFLPKPLSAQAVLLEWGKSQRGEAIVDRAPRVRLFARVYASGEESGSEQVLAYEIHDISHSGAFLVTHGPLPVGTRFELTIAARADSFGPQIEARVLATVVRVQEPSWIHVGGVGVKFDSPDADTELTLADMTRRGIREER